MSSTPAEAELESALDSAKRRHERALQARDFAEIRVTSQAVLAAERALFAARNEPHAVPIEFPVQWDAGAPLPHLLQNDSQVFLLFLLAESNGPETLAVVEFKGCVSTRMGTPNDEVFHGHPLNGRGLELYSPLLVKNSPWIEQLKAISSVHRNYRPESWKDDNHYIFGFHDCTLECVARSFVVEARAGTMRQALADICGKMAEY
ncbi:MAG: hypothetical protein DI543_05845 [Bradyrhizobium icense]|nr:MAG: hypothetical protein DI543_05845 [Bradyrhizobium icense]